MGKIRHGGEVYNGEHQPIIPAETWHAARRIRESAAKTRQNGGGRHPKGTHVLTKGLLRCGHCGSAMTPMTRASRAGKGKSSLSRAKPWEAYGCHGRIRNGEDYCSQPPVQRASVDDAILAELSNRYLDLDETRRRLRQKRQSDAALADEALTQAEAEALRATERISRVMRAFQDGYLDPADYAEQRAALIEERDGAQAQAERIRRRTVEAVEDETDEVLRQLADLRAAVLGGIETAPGLNALRRLVRQVYDMVVYVPADHPINREGKAYLQPRASVQIEEQVPPPTVADPACGHPLHTADCPECQAFEDACYAEPYDPSQPDPYWIVRKVALPPDLFSEANGLPTYSENDALAALFAPIPVEVA
jgi:hypothetical protein